MMDTELFELFDDCSSNIITDELTDNYIDADINSSLSETQDFFIAEDMQQENIFDNFINLFDDVYNSIAGDEHTVTIDNFITDKISNKHGEGLTFYNDRLYINSYLGYTAKYKFTKLP